MISVSASLIASAVLLGDQVQAGAIAVPVAFVVAAKTMGLYDRDEHLLNKSTLDEVPALFGLATVATLVLWLLGGTIVEGSLGRGQVLVGWIVLFVLLLCLRTLARAFAGSMASTERCLLIGNEDAGPYVRNKLMISPAVKAELVGVVPSPLDDFTNDVATFELPDQFGEMLAEREIDRVILAPEAGGRDALLFVIRDLKAFGVKVSFLPEDSRLAGSSVELDHLNGMTLLGMRRFEITHSSRVVKRGLDLAGACVGLAFLAPIYAAASIAIKIETRGPVLFRQCRIGRDSQKFEMLKFRSMVVGADEQKAEVEHLNEGAIGLFKILNDPRVTRVGRLIRRWRIDELPQLVNVLRGEMSLVGPRPLIPEEDRRIEGWYRRRLEVRPGMTGHWQVLGSSTQIPLAEMVKLDYLYVANWSLWGDIRLLLRTAHFLPRNRGV